MAETNTNTNSNQELAQAPIGKLMRNFSIPCIVSLLVAALYNIVDQIFIANAAYLGSYGNAANNAVYPLTVVAISLAVWLGDGCCAFSGFSLGQNREKDAKRSVGNSIVLCVAVSIVLTVIYFVFADQLIAMFGGTVNDETFAFSKEYLFYITMGIPFYMFGQCVNPIIRGDGNPRFAMMVTVSGAIVNTILDPIFIFVFKWGMMGAAVATITGQIVVAAISLWYLFHMRILQPSKRDFRLKKNICVRTLALGTSSFLSQISIVFSMAAINNMVVIFGAKDEIFSQAEYSHIPLAVIGIVMKFFQIVISIVVGLSAGCIPIVSFNMGAGLKGRVKELFKKLLLCEALVGLAAFILVEFFPTQIIGIFGASGESIYYTQFAVRAFRIYLSMIILACINKCCFIVIQGMGRAGSATLLSLLREIVFGVGFALLLPQFFGLDGVLLSMPAADLVTFLIAIALIISVFRQLNEKDAPNAQAQTQ